MTSSTDPVREPLSPRRQVLWLPLGLLGVGWFLVVPVLAFQAWMTTWHLYGEAPSAFELRTQEHRFAIACGLSLAVVVAGFALAVAVRSTVAASVFAVLLVPTLLLGLLWLGSWQSRQPHPTPSPSPRTSGHCQEFSGSDNRCPGG